jgi:hypothetical protein
MPPLAVEFEKSFDLSDESAAIRRHVTFALVCDQEAYFRRM